MGECTDRGRATAPYTHAPVCRRRGPTRRRGSGSRSARTGSAGACTAASPRGSGSCRIAKVVAGKEGERLDWLSDEPTVCQPGRVRRQGQESTQTQSKRRPRACSVMRGSSRIPTLRLSSNDASRPASVFEIWLSVGIDGASGYKASRHKRTDRAPSSLHPTHYPHPPASSAGTGSCRHTAARSR